ncbi:uncharacterized protein FRV6_11399 [Fusarium oxysporum]|uniref:Uncharacterized protein n=1 Tax=Fusarium oxysporum TaxID=5507 RepID=A0A2H3TF31_FUSOX|nr:uncharacterized protein FRV6_11399 [Fusarium oxysporum]
MYYAFILPYYNTLKKPINT